MSGSRFGVATTVALMAVLLGGCTPSVPSPASAPASTTPPSASSHTTAHLVTRTLHKSGVPGQEPGMTCEYELTWAAVQNLDPDQGPAVHNTLNKALELTADPRQCELGGIDITGGYRDDDVSVNKNGVLSLTYRLDFFASGAAHPNAELRTFALDLRTGAPITLNQLLTEAGKQTMATRCTAALTADPRAGGPVDPTYCTDAVTGPHPAFTISPNGLVAQPFNNLPHIAQGLAEGGVLVTWSELGAGLRGGTVVAPFAGR